MFNKTLILSCLATICFTVSACSSSPNDQPDLGLVKGVVILDGSPVAGVMVQFSPENGRASIGITDNEGNYELTYVRQTKGAVIGKHKVVIITPEGDDDSDPDAPVVEEKIPEQYNTKSTLTAEVKAGENRVDFELLSNK